MKRLSSADVVEIWEAGQRRGAASRATAIVAAAFPELAGEVGALTLGEWQARLARVRRQLFGSTLEAFAECPSCGERLEFALDAGRLGDAEGRGAEVVRELSIDGIELRFRLLTVDDFAAAARCRDPAGARRVLAEACVLDASIEGEPAAARDLPEAAIAALADALLEGDPGAETVVELECPACGRASRPALDLAPFLWTELSADAERLLGEVDALARAYGWTESEVLALGPERRRRYLEMAL